MPVWTVLRADVNHGGLDRYNIFEHGGFARGCQEVAQIGIDDREQFLDRIRDELIYWFWSRCEWEVLVSLWPASERYLPEKIDAFDQIDMNWEPFAEYIWSHRADLLPKDTKNGKE